MKKTNYFLMLLLVEVMSVLSTQFVYAQSYRNRKHSIEMKYYPLLNEGKSMSPQIWDSYSVTVNYLNVYSRSEPAKQKELTEYYTNCQKEIKELEQLLTEEEKRKAFKKTQVGGLVQPLFDKIEKLAEKGEYEKTVDYEQRMKTQLVDSAIIWCERLSNSTIKLTVKKIQYDPDKEEVTLEISKDYVFFSSVNIPLSVDAAKKMGEFSFTNYYISDIHEYDLSCVLKRFDTELYPGSVSFTFEGKRYTVNAPAGLQLEDLIIDLSEVENAGKYLKGYKYNVTTKELITPKTSNE